VFWGNCAKCTNPSLGLPEVQTTQNHQRAWSDGPRREEAEGETELKGDTQNLHAGGLRRKHPPPADSGRQRHPDVKEASW
jgi:hypothetical protein